MSPRAISARHVFVIAHACPFPSTCAQFCTPCRCIKGERNRRFAKSISHETASCDYFRRWRTKLRCSRCCTAYSSLRGIYFRILRVTVMRKRLLRSMVPWSIHRMKAHSPEIVPVHRPRVASISWETYWKKRKMRIIIKWSFRNMTHYKSHPRDNNVYLDNNKSCWLLISDASFARHWDCKRL